MNKETNFKLRSMEEKPDWRSPFAVDRDRIIYSGAYKRCAGKTQVVYFSAQRDEQISNRMVHIQYVSQIGRTIGKSLDLDLDLIEAAALGHDLGHTPFGHDGERFLAKLCEENGIGTFLHNIHSLYIVDKFSYHGKGMNLTWPVRNAIVAHNGEKNITKLGPMANYNPKSLETITNTPVSPLIIHPATMEACVIFLTDTIAYIGTDVEDAIRLGLITRSEIPPSIKKILGDNNGSIIGTLVSDLITNSSSSQLLFSDVVGKAQVELKKFNYSRIYNHPKLKREKLKIEKGFRILFETYLEDLHLNNRESAIYSHFLDGKNENYQDLAAAVKVRDFIASMTDRYFKWQLERIIIPGF